MTTKLKQKILRKEELKLLGVIGGTAILIALGLPIMAVLLSLQSSPLVQPEKPLTYEDAERVRTILKENNPRRMEAEEIKTVVLSERDCNLMLNFALSRSPGNQRVFSSISFDHSVANIKATVVLPSNPIGAFLNVRFGLSPSDRYVDLTHLSIGNVSLPAWILNGLRTVLFWYAESRSEMSILLEAMQSLKNLEFKKGNAKITYQWRPAVMKQIKQKGQNLLFNDRQKALFLVYYKLASDLALASGKKKLPLSHFLPALFQLAQLRTEEGSPAINENRMLLFAISSFVMGSRVHRVLGTEPIPEFKDMEYTHVTLNGRVDLTKHFLVSASIVASAGSGLAYFAGVFKEVSDSKGGSGFSFADLLADRAGIRLGEMAVTSSYQATQLQEKMINVRSNADFMPVEDRLPEGLQEKDFKDQFTNLDSESYQKIEGEIDKRINGCSLFR